MKMAGGNKFLTSVRLHYRGSLCHGQSVCGDLTSEPAHRTYADTKACTASRRTIFWHTGTSGQRKCTSTTYWLSQFEFIWPKASAISYAKSDWRPNSASHLRDDYLCAVCPQIQKPTIDVIALLVYNTRESVQVEVGIFPYSSLR